MPSHSSSRKRQYCRIIVDSNTCGECLRHFRCLVLFTVHYRCWNVNVSRKRISIIVIVIAYCNFFLSSNGCMSKGASHHATCNNRNYTFLHHYSVSFISHISTFCCTASDTAELSSCAWAWAQHVCLSPSQSRFAFTHFQFIEIASVIGVNLEKHAVTGTHMNVRYVQHIVQSHLWIQKLMQSQPSTRCGTARC